MVDNDLLTRLQRDANSPFGVPYKITGYCYLGPYIRLINHAIYSVDHDAQEITKPQLGQVILSAWVVKNRAIFGRDTTVALPFFSGVCLN